MKKHYPKLKKFAPLFFLLFTITAFSQISGDFRSSQNGSWSTPGSWDIYNGTDWFPATTSYPGQFTGNYTVTIQTGHTITIGTNFVTTSMGSVIVNGILILKAPNPANVFIVTLNTLSLTVSGTGSVIKFDGTKISLYLPAGALIELLNGGNLDGGTNYNDDIYIGIQRFAVWVGSGSNYVTFNEVYDAGGTINANITAPISNPTTTCGLQSTTLQGSYSGLVGTPVIYKWTVKDPNNTEVVIPITSSSSSSFSFTPSSPLIPGDYLVSFKVSTTLYDITLYNIETRTITVKDKNKWNGSVSSDWNTSENWCCGLPSVTNNLDVIIPTNPTGGRYPILSPFVDITYPEGYVENILFEIDSKLTVEGNYLFVKTNLTLNGKIDLNNEAQLVQDDGSTFSGDGSIEIDQQGTANSFNYNYWSSPVYSNPEGTFTVKGVLMDGTVATAPKIINFQPAHWSADTGVTSPIIISSYWLYTFYGADDNYWAWKQINQDKPILAGEGYTMKGTSGKAPIANQQNYVFRGKPYNGDFTLHIDQGKDRLIGNPYPSAMDANKFINDNIKIIDGGSNTTQNVFNGALYFWDHFGYVNSHNLGAYVGGYATYTKMGGSKAYSNDARINNNGSRGNKRPGQYIPVGQGFFVIAVNDTLSNSLKTPIITGGDIVFKNSQRIFKKEGSGNSVFMKGVKSKKDKTEIEINNDKRPKIWLQFESPSGYHRQMLIGADENTTNHFDLGFDAFIADVGSEDMFWTFDGAKFVIQGVPNFDDNQEFPIGVKIAKAGLARIKIDELVNMDEDISVHIKDKLTGETHNISQKPFEINLEKGTYLDRFALIFKMQKLVAEDVVAEILIPAAMQPIIEGIHVFMNNAIGELQIKNNSNEEITSVALINSLGQTVKTWNSNFNIRTISLPISAVTGVYLVQIISKTGKTIKKISVE